MEIVEHPANTSKLHPTLQNKPLWQILLEGVGLVIAIFVLLNLVTVRFVVEGTSMLPTFETGQYLVVSRVHYLIGTPQRGDVLVFHLPINPERDFIKRVIAIPGDTIEFRDTQVYINGVQLYEPYIEQACDRSVCGDGIWQIGLDEYFVMGDNRNLSSDSRFFGAINSDHIVGKAILRYYPFSELDSLHQIGIDNG